jgi:hypothetical protein
MNLLYTAQLPISQLQLKCDSFNQIKINRIHKKIVLRKKIEIK